MNDYDETPDPAQLYLQLQRERAAQARNFVAPAPLARREPTTIDAVPQWVVQAQPFDVGQAWQPLAAAKEATSAVDRAKGLRIRLLPFVGLYALAGVVVGGTVLYVAANVPLAALFAVVTFALLGILTYRRMNLDDYDHSGAGVERLRISEAAQLQREQMEHEQELRRMALESYLKWLENRDR